MTELSELREVLPEALRNLVSEPISLQGFPFTIESLYVTDTGAIIRLAQNEGGDGTPVTKELLASVIGSITRIVSDLLNQAGVMVPCFCVVGATTNSVVAEAVSELATDQDWNRGDFALLLETRGLTGEDEGEPMGRVVSEIVLDFDYADFEVSMDPVSRNDVARRYHESVRALNLSPDHAELTDILRECLNSDLNPSDALQRWVKQKKGEIEGIK